MNTKSLMIQIVIWIALLAAACLSEEVASGGIGPFKMEPSLTHVVNAGQTILSGDCADFIDLTGFNLPTVVGGTTIDATNDYGPYPERPTCWQGEFNAASAASSDITYKWTAPSSAEYDFYILTESYNSTIALYQFTCPTEPRYPEDFICGNDNWSGGQSKLSNILLTQGQEILIIVDGNGTSEGEFYLMIAYAGEYEPLVCQEHSLFGQPGPRIGQDYDVITSDLYRSNWRAYDNIPDFSGTIYGVGFWGCDSRYSGGYWNECDESEMVFDAAFWTNGIDNKPDQLINNFIIFPARTATWASISVGQHVFGTVYHYQAIFDEPMPVNGGWISVQGVSQQTPTDCNFIWLASVNPGDTCWSYNGSQWLCWDGGALSFCLLDSMASSIYDNTGEIPNHISLEQNYPNPFNGQTIIDFSLAVPSYVFLDVYDILGRKVEQLLNNYMEPGDHQVIWNGDKYPSGIYLYKLNAGGHTEVKKMQLLK